MSEKPPEDTLSEALKKNWYLLIPSVVLVVLGFVLGSWPREAYDASRNEGVTKHVELPRNSPAARSANENFVKRPVGAAQNKRKGIQAERKYLAQLEELSPQDEEYPLTLFRLGNVYYAAIRDYEKAIPYFEELADNYPDHPKVKSALMYMADCHVKTGQRDKEAQMYEDLMEKHPWESEIHKWAERQLTQIPRNAGGDNDEPEVDGQ